MQVTEIAVSERRGVTVGIKVGGKDQYDKREYFTSLTASLTPEDIPREVLLTLSGIVASHNLKLIRGALEDGGGQVDKLIETRQEQMIPESAKPDAPKPQVFTQKPSLANCADCGTEIKNEKTLEIARKMNRPARCFPCYKKTTTQG